jgi:outer membrane protein with beta-barrel domain
MKTLTMIAAAVLLCSASSARAESSRRSTSTLSSTSAPKLLLGVDGSFGMPLGTYADVNGVGGGVLLTAEYPLVESVSATARIGFNYQLDKSVPAVGDMHVHSIPILFGAKYYVMPERQGLFAAAEIGMFDLMSSISTPGGSGSANDLKFGGGVGLGWQMKQWNARVNLHSHDFGNFGDLMMVSAGVGYQFAGF